MCNISYKFLQTYIVYTPLHELHQIRDVTSIDLSVGATTVKMQCYSVTGSLSQWYSVIVLQHAAVVERVSDDRSPID